MKRLLLVLVVLCVCSIPALAADGPTELTGSFSLVNAENGDDYFTFSGDLQAPIGKLFGLGPSIQYLDINPEEGDSSSIWSIGALATFAFTESHNGFFLAAEALWPQGDQDVQGYLLSPGVGVRFGNDKAFARILAAHPFHMDSGDDDSSLDLERTEVTAGFGYRWGK
jgi:hypothetical protein